MTSAAPSRPSRAQSTRGGYSLGPALFALVGINRFLIDSVHELAGAGITREEARETMLATHGLHGAHVINPEQARLVVDQAPHNAVDAIHTLSLIMAMGPIAAIILALWLIKPADPGR